MMTIPSAVLGMMAPGGDEAAADRVWGCKSMDDETRKIGMLIAAFDAEHERLKIAIGALQKAEGGRAAAAGIQRCCQGIGESVAAALSGLNTNTEVQKASKTLID